MRSRNQRSWLMTTAQPAKSSSAVFERAQRVHVEVVGGLVEQQHVGALLEHLGQDEPVALAAREFLDQLLLVGALEVEHADVGPRGHRALARPDLVEPARDLLEHGLLAVQAVARLVHVGQLDGLADAQRAGVGLLLPVIMRKSVVLPAPLGPMTPTMPPRREARS